MGCDIHGVVERQIDTGKWVTVRTLDCHYSSSLTAREADQRFSQPLALARNYERFAALAGVRGPGPDPRGMPDDASDTARWKFENEGDHTPSWLPLAEAASVFARTEHDGTGDQTEFTKKWPAYTYFGIDAEDLSPYRLVFWFDS